MTLRAWFHWFLFVVYFALFFAVPLAILWGGIGALFGVALSCVFLWFMGFRGNRRISARLNVKALTAAEAPVVSSIVNEYCRRLQMPVPKLGVIETPAMNIGMFGFSRQTAVLVFTRGTLEKLNRTGLAALIGRELSHLWFGDIFCDSWLSQFLSLLDRMLSPTRPKSAAQAKRFYPFRLFVRQAFLYPLALFPMTILKLSKDPSKLDLKSVRLTRRPQDLAEALRRLEAMQERTPFTVPFSTRHLFLVSPSAQDPLTRVFFGSFDLSSRITAVESLKQLVALR